MRLYSTKNTKSFVSFQEAVFKGLPNDNGLYMPEFIPQLPSDFIENLKSYSFQEIGFEICKHLFRESIPDDDIQSIVKKSINFPAPLIMLEDGTYILELFHGPSLAFKDVGARFMAQLMSYFNQANESELVILVATSGDTGGAVAAGFYKTLGVKLVILYPAGKVSGLQEKQLTTLGENVLAIEVEGTFDDCQTLVKQAFLDKELNLSIRLSSANSINIARLIPQSFYYFEAYKQLHIDKKNVTFSVPSGNFGNLTAGLFAKKMGLPVYQFIAATNANDIVPVYLHTGIYSPQPSIPTLSNAMDVGNPSNFARMMEIYRSTWNVMREDIKGYSFDDAETEIAMLEIFEKYDYMIDPHGAVGYLALKQHKKQNKDIEGIILETAHPAKFLNDVERILHKKIEVPQRLAILSEKEKIAKKIKNDFGEFKGLLLNNY